MLFNIHPCKIIHFWEVFILNKRVYYKWLFIIAAIHAWLMVVPGYILSYMEPPFTQEALYYYQFSLMLVILFALGYLIVGLNIEKNHGIVLLTIIGKLWVFIFVTLFYLQGIFPFIVFIVGISDLIFAFLYIEFLVNYKKL